MRTTTNRSNKAAVLRRCRYVLLATVMVCVVFLSSCDPIASGYRETEADGYRTLTIENDLVSYSLEYSTYYHHSGPSGDLEWKIPFVAIMLVAPSKPVEMEVPTGKANIDTVSLSYAPAFINVDVSDRSGESERSRLASGFLDIQLKDRERDVEFELLERRSIMVAGVAGELVVFKDEWQMGLWAKDMPAVGYFRWVYFDYGGLVWEIKSMAEEGLAERVAADIDHIIETFRILAPEEDS